MVGFFCICDVLVFDKLRGMRLNFSLHNKSHANNQIKLDFIVD